MMEDYGKNIYKILSQLIKVSFVKYLKNSGIEFTGIYQVKNLANNIDFFLLELNNTQIRFKSSKDFLLQFMVLLRTNIENYENEYRKLTMRTIDEFTDELGIERSYKQIENYIYQQTELLKAIKIEYDKVALA